jgi:zinc transporter 1/2/3
MAKKLSLAAAFALVTPLGMAIGIGVLHQFNGNDPQTIVAIGVLDAFSAGILLWVGVVEMWAADWVHAGGALTDAGLATTCIGLGGLVAGMIVMSVLGKWA